MSLLLNMFQDNISLYNSSIFLFHTILVLAIALLLFRIGKIYLISFIAVCAVLANIYVLRQIDVFGLSATGGNVMYAAIFFSLNEFYGKKEAQKAVFVGFASALLFLITSQLILLYIPNDADFSNEAFKTFFSLTPRIVLGSLFAYLISQNLDVIIFNKLKALTHGKYLWLRNNGSTLLSQLIDSILFTLVAFFGVLSNSVILEIIVFTYVLKVIIALLDTPFIYLAKRIKR